MSGPERKYALTKIDAGDYLLPSNDATTIWRLRKAEDGPTYGLDAEVHPRDFTVWQLWRWDGRVAPGVNVDVESWDRWELIDQSCRTRGEAVREAMRLEGAELS